MKVGIFADAHDHLDNIRRVVRMFNEHHCACVLFAGDLVSTFAVPPLRKLQLLTEPLPERGLSVLSILRSRRQVMDMLRPFRGLAEGSERN